MCFGRDLQGPQQRHRPPHSHIDIAPPGRLQHSAGVPLRVVRGCVARERRDRHKLGVRAGTGVQEGEGVVDPRVNVKDQRCALSRRGLRINHGHPAFFTTIAELLPVPQSFLASTRNW